MAIVECYARRRNTLYHVEGVDDRARSPCVGGLVRFARPGVSLPLTDVTETLPPVPGLTYLRDYLDAAAHDALLAHIDSQPWHPVNGERRIQFYGYWYNHAKGGMYRIGDLPDWALPVAERLERDGLTPVVADQLIVNEYVPGQGIRPHVDLPDAFGPAIVSVSLGSSCVMEFTHVQHGTRAILLEPHSALVMTGEARQVWQHSIPARAADEWMGRTWPRSRRVSLTFRKSIASIH